MLYVGTHDVQDLTVHNDILTVTFLNASTAKGAFIILAISETMAPNFTFEYVPVKKSPSSNIISIEIATLLRTIAGSVTNSSLLIILVYDIENTGLLKDSMHLMPVKILMLNASTLLTDNSNHNGEFSIKNYVFYMHTFSNSIEMNTESESDWGLVNVSSTSHSIKIVCKILTEPEAINGCSAIVHDQLSIPQEFILAVNNSDNGGLKHTLEFEVEVQNRGNLYNYVVFPITSKGIIGSRAVKGIIHINNGKHNNTIISD